MWFGAPGRHLNQRALPKLRLGNFRQQMTKPDSIR